MDSLVEQAHWVYDVKFVTEITKGKKMLIKQNG
jgi:hypothetical protein